MVLRQAEAKDLSNLAKIYTNHYSNDFALNLENTYSHLVVEDKELIAFGWLQLITEVNVMFDLDSSGRKRFEALSYLLHNCKEVAKDNGFDQVHAFTKNPKFSEILKKHHNFRNVTGDALVLDITNGKE